jgi:predicted CoA-binding protein
MIDLTQLLDDPGTTFAIVGATDSPGKYGGIIYRDLRGKGWQVYAVNPARTSVAGDPCWANVSDLPVIPTIAVLVVPADRGLEVLADCSRAGIRHIWVQPGASSRELRQALDAGGFDWLAGACVMVEAGAAV